MIDYKQKRCLELESDIKFGNITRKFGSVLKALTT